MYKRRRESLPNEVGRDGRSRPLQCGAVVAGSSGSRRPGKMRTCRRFVRKTSGPTALEDKKAVSEANQGVYMHKRPDRPGGKSGKAHKA